MVGGIVGAVTAGVLCFVWVQLAVPFLEARIPLEERVPKSMSVISEMESWERSRREFFLFLGLGIATGFVVGALYGRLTGRGATPDAGAVRKPILPRAAGVVVAALALILAVAAESLIVTQLRQEAVLWLGGETYRRDVRQAAVVERLERLRSAPPEEFRGPNPLFTGMGVRSLLDDWSGDDRVLAVVFMGKDAVPGLVALSNDPKPHTRQLAVITLARMDPPAPEATLALIGAAKSHTDAAVRASAAAALAKRPATPGTTDDAIPTLIGAIKDDDVVVRNRAAEALGVMLATPQTDGPAPGGVRAGAPETKEAVAALTEALKDQTPEVRSRAAEALAKIGPAAKGAVPALMEALKDENERVRSAAALALEVIDPDAAKKARAK
jgi:hypothetical protein